MKIKSRIFIILSLLVVLFCSFLIYTVNAKTPPAKEINVAFGEEFIADDLSISAIDFEYISLSKFFELYPDVDKKEFEENGEIKTAYILIPTLKIKNMSNNTENCPLYFFTLETNIWSNGIDMEIFLALNPEKSLDTKINPGSEITVKLPYLIHKTQFLEDDWSNVLHDKYAITLSTYPEYIRLYLK